MGLQPADEFVLFQNFPLPPLAAAALLLPGPLRPEGKAGHREQVGFFLLGELVEVVHPIEDLLVLLVEPAVAPALELGEGGLGLVEEGSGGEVLLEGGGVVVLSAGDCEVEADFLFFVFLIL